MLTISLGSRGGCDAQYLFSANLLDENRRHIPRHAKSFRNFAADSCKAILCVGDLNVGF